METEDEIARKFNEQFIQNKIDYLKDLTKNHKIAVEKCVTAEISSNVWIISQTTRYLKDNVDKLTISQSRELDNLENQYIAQFDKLRKGYCECKPKIKG